MERDDLDEGPEEAEKKHRSQVFQRYQEHLEIDAIRRSIRAAGLDVTDPDDERKLTALFVSVRARVERRERWQKRRAGTVVWVGATVGGAGISLLLPDLLSWLKTHLGSHGP